MKAAYFIAIAMLFGPVVYGRFSMHKAMNFKGKPTTTTVQPARNPVLELIQKVRTNQAMYFDITSSGPNPHFNPKENLVALGQELIAKSCFNKRFFNKDPPKYVNCDKLFSMGKPVRKMELEIRERYHKLVEEYCSKQEGNCIYY